jgi:hypothetical protein
MSQVSLYCATLDPFLGTLAYGAYMSGNKKQYRVNVFLRAVRHYTEDGGFIRDSPSSEKIAE